MTADQGMVGSARREGAGIGGGRDQIHVVTGLRLTSGRARDLDRLARRVARRSARAAPRPAGPPRGGAARPARVGELAERGEHVLLGLRAEPLEVSDPLLLGGGLSQLVEAGHAQLVEEPAGRLRAEPRDPRHLDQPRPETSLQLGRRRDLAGLDEREDLPWSVLPTPGSSVAPALARELLDRNRALRGRCEPPPDRRAPGIGSPRRARTASPAR